MGSLSLKHLVLVILSAGMAIAASFIGSALVDGKLPWVAVVIVVILLFGEIALVAYRTEDERLLALLKKKERDQLLREGLELEAIDERIREEIKKGNLQKAQDWEKFRRRLQ